MSKADDAVRFINKLTHTKGQWARKTFALRPWQEHGIVRPLFGTLQADGLRQYRRAFVMLPRKNGKSELAAALALYLLMADGEEGAEVYSAAADREQASLVFNVAAQMVRNDPGLSRRCKIVDSQKRIVFPRTGSFYRAISSEAHTKHGFNASAVIYDEVHAAPNRELWDVLTTSMGARQQPLVFGITTAGYDRHSLAYELYDYAVKVRDGIIQDPTFLPVLYSAPDDADWTDEAVWRAANPALEDFRGVEEMRMLAAEAKEIPARQNTFRRLYLNQWTEQDERWIDLAVWDRNAAAVPDEELVGRVCYAGLDLSTTTDISALVLVFPLDDGRYALRCRFWVPREGMIQRERRDRVPYSQWASEGHIEPTEGNVVDYDVIRARINEDAGRYQIREVAYDPWNATDIAVRLMADGANMVEMRQGFATLSSPTKGLEKSLLEGTLCHGGHPVLRWMASNVAVRQDPAGNLKPDKAKSQDRIDGIVATIMALGRAKIAVEAASVYESRDLLVL